MINQSETPIIIKTYDFYKTLHQAVKLFSREEKYTLGEKIKSLAIEILEFLLEAEYRPKPTKIELLDKASVKLDLSKLLIRLCYDVKLINDKKYFLIEEQLQEIGKMLGGWIKSVKNT